MKITRDNYEVVFIDYFDGTLDAAAVAELRAFLELHPDLKAEFDSFSPQPLEAANLVFENKSSLKRGEITEHNIQSYLNAEVNQDLSATEQEELNHFLNNYPRFQHDRDLYAKTILHADLSVVFPDKRKLKQPVPIAFNTPIVRYAIAAMLLLSLLAGSVYLFNKSSEKSERQVATADQSPVKNNAASTAQPSSMPDDVQIATSEKSESNEAMKRSSSPAPSLMKAPDSNSHNRISVQHHSQQLAHRSVSKEELAPSNHQGNNVDMVPVLSASLQSGQHSQQPALNSATPAAGQPVPNTTAPEYLTVWEALRKAGDANIKKITSPGDETLALANESSADKLKVRDVVEKGIEKISGDKIQLDGGDKEQRNSFRFAIGNFSIEKN